MQTLASKTIRPPDNVSEVKYLDTNTKGIISVIVHAMNYTGPDTKDFAPCLESDDIIETLNNVWTFVKKSIKYKLDKPGFEDVKSPAKTWKDKYGDCKSMSLFVSSLLKNLGIPHFFRFASYDNGPVTHVYVCALVDNEVIPVDTVHTKFGEEVEFSKCKDYIQRMYKKYL